MKCGRCGAEMPINRLYCDECGAELEHDLTEVQATVDREVRLEKAQSLAKSIRWFLAAAFVLAIIGYYFRKAYRDLPGNDIVAFATAPTVPVEDEVCAGTQQFGVLLPDVREAPPVPPPANAAEVDARVLQAAMRDALVALKRKGIRDYVHCLLDGDAVLFLPVPDRAEPLPVHVADIRRIRPLGQNQWEIEARTLEKAVRVTFPDPTVVAIPIVERRTDGKIVRQSVALDQIQELKPL